MICSVSGARILANRVEPTATPTLGTATPTLGKNSNPFLNHTAQIYDGTTTQLQQKCRNLDYRS